MASEQEPIVVDLGKARKKAIKSLKKGEGKLLSEVQLALQELRAKQDPALANKDIVPIIFVYKQKAKTKKRRGLFF